MKETGKIRILSLLTMLAFIANVFVPFFAVYNIPSAQAAEKSELSSFFGDKILICTSDGFKWVTWEELQNEENEHPDPNQKHYECPLCYVSAHGVKDFLPVSAVSFTHELIEKRATGFAYTNITAKSRFSLAGYQTRAPPHLT